MEELYFSAGMLMSFTIALVPFSINLVHLSFIKGSGTDAFPSLLFLNHHYRLNIPIIALDLYIGAH
jgi:hypothetical protein